MLATHALFVVSAILSNKIMVCNMCKYVRRIYTDQDQIKEPPLKCLSEL